MQKPNWDCIFFHIVARFNTLRPRAARGAWEGLPPQAPRRRLAAEAAQAAEPVDVLLWLALVPWPVWWLVLWLLLLRPQLLLLLL